MTTSKKGGAPILASKLYEELSAFKPEALLREGRRQRGRRMLNVPDICVLDPDGDLVRRLRRDGAARVHEGWACYHTELLEFEIAGHGTLGIIGCAVGAPFAVLVAEQLFASGCRLLVSVTSAGQIADRGPPPYYVLIDRALRDEGTSYHYQPPSEFADGPGELIARIEAETAQLDAVVHRGATWTTDAPYRETEAAIAVARGAGALAVEMEAAALYAFAAARGKAVVCFAHVTNTMAQDEGDFEKGEADGTVSTLAVIAAAARGWAAMTSAIVDASEIASTPDVRA